MIVVDEALPAGRAVNAAVCVAAATASGVSGLLGPDAEDAGGVVHPGLPWAGCTVLGAPTERLATIRAEAGASPEVYVAAMLLAAQTNRVYSAYLDEVVNSEEQTLSYLAISLVGPRHRVDTLG